MFFWIQRFLWPKLGCPLSHHHPLVGLILSRQSSSFSKCFPRQFLFGSFHLNSTIFVGFYRVRQLIQRIFWFPLWDNILQLSLNQSLFTPWVFLLTFNSIIFSFDFHIFFIFHLKRTIIRNSVIFLVKYCIG